MKRFLSVCLAIITLFSALSLTSCKKKAAEKEQGADTPPTKNGIIYSSVDLSKHIKIGDYKKIKVDTESDLFEYYYDSVIRSDIENGKFYKKKTKGTVNNGDIVNINYTGYKDGEKFEDGEATNYDLEIGLGMFFAPGFEESLIDKKIGSTDNIGITLPENFGVADLAGKYVTFTVTINYVLTTEPLKPRDYYKDLGYKTLSEYNEATEKTAVKNYLLENFLTSCSTTSYPENELEYITYSELNLFKKQIEMQFGMTLDEYLTTAQITLEQLESQLIEEQIKPTMDAQMAVFYLLKKEGKSITKEEVDALVQTSLEGDNYGVSAEELLDYKGEYYFEYLVALEKALDILYNYAVIS